MENFKIVSTKLPSGKNDMEVVIQCSANMLIAGLKTAILNINDATNSAYTVKNEFWLMLNSEVCAELDRRAKKR